MTLEPVHPLFGVELVDGDLAAMTAADQARALRLAVATHGFVLARDTALDDDTLVALARALGDPLPGYRPEFTHPRFRELVRLGNIRDPGLVTYLNTQGVEWHSDATGSGHPPGVTLLDAVEAPERGGDTLLATTTAAVREMPADLRDRLEGIEEIHNFDHHNDIVASFAGTNVRPRGQAQRRRNADVVDRILDLHPDTGERHLFLSPQVARAMVGVPATRAKHLVERVMAHVTRSKYVYRHRWRAGDTLIFDNRSVIHSATDYDYPDERRYMRQIIVNGFA